jgi:hypothetical protein
VVAAVRVRYHPSRLGGGGRGGPSLFRLFDHFMLTTRRSAYVSSVRPLHGDDAGSASVSSVRSLHGNTFSKVASKTSKKQNQTSGKDMPGGT